MAQSAGALFLQVKLDIGSAERELAKLGRQVDAAFAAPKIQDSGAKAAVAQAKAAVEEQKRLAVQAKAAANERIVALQKEQVAIKAKAEADKQAAITQRANARQAAVEANKAAKAQQVSTKASVDYFQAQRRLSSRFWAPYIAQQKQAEAQTRALAKAQREAAREAARISAERGKRFGDATGGLTNAASYGISGINTAGSNPGFAIFALSRAFSSLGSAASGAGSAIAVAAAPLITYAVAATGATIALTALSEKIVSAGVEGASSFETLRIQLSSLLGDAQKGQSEFDWLIKLGQTSVIPTQSLVEADRLLIGFGVTADNTRRQLVELFSNVGSALSLSQDQIYFLSLAIGQVVSKGKADAVDFRQIANAGIPTARLLESISKQTGQSLAETKKKFESGGLSASEVVAGLTGLTQQYKGAADAAAKSTAGLAQNLKDTFSSGLSNAFLKGGVLEPIKSFLADILSVLSNSQGLFDNLAAAARNFFDALAGGSAASTAINFFQTLVQETLPNFLNGIGDAIRAIREPLAAAFQSIGIFLSSFSQIFADTAANAGATVSPVAAVADAVAIVTGSFAALGVIANGVFSFILQGVQAVFQAVQGDFDGAVATMRNGLISLATGLAQAQQIFQAVAVGVGSTLTGAGRRPATPGNGISPGGRGGKTPTSGTSTRGAEDAASASKQQIAAAKAAAQKIAQARDSLYELLKSAFGQPSDALKGLFGDGKTFTATADSIVSAAKKITDALEVINPKSPLIAFVDQETRKLLALAKQRDTVAEALTKAQDKLKSLYDDRQQLVDQLKNQAQSFVFDLNVGQQNIYTRLDSVGSFAITQAPESFAAAVKRRLAEYKTFVSNIRKLQKLGLDKSIIRQFLEAGPEAAGQIVAQVASGGSSVIADLNAAQRDLTKLAKEFGVQQGGIFYNQGISQAQSVVAGLKSKQGNIDKQAKVIVDAILRRIRPLAAKLKDTGASGGSGLSNALKKSTSSLPDWAAGLQKSFAGISTALDPKAARAQATSWVDGIIGQFQRLGLSLPQSVATVGAGVLAALFPNPFTIGAAVASFVYSIVSQFSAAWPAARAVIGSAFGALLSLFPTWDDIKKRIDEIISGVKDKFNEFKRWFDKNNPWAILLSKIPTVAQIKSKLYQLFSGAYTYLVSVKNTIAGGLGGIWSFLTSGIPSLSTLLSSLGVIPTAFKAIFNKVIGFWNAIDFGFTITIPDWFSKIPGPVGGLAGKQWSIPDLFPDVPSLATGGVATRPMLATIGDAPFSRGEAVVPLNRSGISDFLGGMSSGDIYLEASVYIGDEPVRGIVRTELRQVDRSTRNAVAAGRRLGG